MFDVNLLYKLFGQQLEKFGLHFNLASPHIVRWYASVYIPNYFNILDTLILKFVYPEQNGFCSGFAFFIMLSNPSSIRH